MSSAIKFLLATIAAVQAWDTPNSKPDAAFNSHWAKLAARVPDIEIFYKGTGMQRYGEVVKDLYTNGEIYQLKCKKFDKSHVPYCMVSKNTALHVTIPVEINHDFDPNPGTHVSDYSQNPNHPDRTDWRNGCTSSHELCTVLNNIDAGAVTVVGSEVLQKLNLITAAHTKMTQLRDATLVTPEQDVVLQRIKNNVLSDLDLNSADNIVKGMRSSFDSHSAAVQIFAQNKSGFDQSVGAVNAMFPIPSVFKQLVGDQKNTFIGNAIQEVNTYVGGLDTYKAQMQSKAAEITNAANQIQQRRESEERRRRQEAAATGEAARSDARALKDKLMTDYEDLKKKFADKLMETVNDMCAEFGQGVLAGKDVDSMCRIRGPETVSSVLALDTASNQSAAMEWLRTIAVNLNQLVDRSVNDVKALPGKSTQEKEFVEQLQGRASGVLKALNKKAGNMTNDLTLMMQTAKGVTAAVAELRNNKFMGR